MRRNTDIVSWTFCWVFFPFEIIHIWVSLVPTFSVWVERLQHPHHGKQKTLECIWRYDRNLARYLNSFTIGSSLMNRRQFLQPTALSFQRREINQLFVFFFSFRQTVQTVSSFRQGGAPVGMTTADRCSSTSILFWCWTAACVTDHQKPYPKTRMLVYTNPLWCVCPFCV